MMNKIKTLLLVVILLPIVSCNKETSKEETWDITGTEKFITDMSNVIRGSALTRADEATEFDMQQFYSLSYDYLACNNISHEDYAEYYTSEDEKNFMTAVLALTLAEINKTTIETKTTVGGCLLQAFGLSELVTMQKLSTKAIRVLISSVGKATLKKAIPYVGQAVFVAEMVFCITEE